MNSKNPCGAQVRFCVQGYTSPNVHTWEQAMNRLVLLTSNDATRAVVLISMGMGYVVDEAANFFNALPRGNKSK